MSFINKLRVSGTDYDLKTSINYESKTVNNWAATSSGDSDYFEQYPFRGTINCSGVTADYTPLVIFSPDDADSGNYAAIANASADVVYIYGMYDDLSPTILNIVCIR